MPLPATMASPSCIRLMHDRLTVSMQHVHLIQQRFMLSCASVLPCPRRPRDGCSCEVTYMHHPGLPFGKASVHVATSFERLSELRRSLLKITPRETPCLSSLQYTMHRPSLRTSYKLSESGEALRPLQYNTVSFMAARDLFSCMPQHGVITPQNC